MTRIRQDLPAGSLKQRLDRFIHHRNADLTVATLIVLSIVCLLLEFSGLFSERWTFIFAVLSDIFTGIFVIELTVRFWVSPGWRAFWRRYWLDVIAVLPVTRSLRLFRVLRLLRIFRAGSLLFRSLSLFQQVLSQGRNEALVLLASIFIVVIAAGLVVHAYEPSRQDFGDLAGSVWWSLLSLIAGEPLGVVPRTLLGRILLIAVMLGGVTVFSMFTGIVTAVMVRRLRSEAEVKAMEIRDISDHILICGWNRMAPLLFREFHSDPRMRDRHIVVVAEFGETDVLALAGSHRERVYPLHGDPTRVEVLEKAGAARAGYAILLADKLVPRADQDRDARTVLTALTLEKMNPRIYTVAELLSRESISHLKLAGVEEVIVGDELSSSLIATSIRNRGTMALVEELFTAQRGCQFYRVALPRRFGGQSFGSFFDAMKRDHDAMPVSVERRSGESMQMLTNPPLDFTLMEGDRVILIARTPPAITAEP